MARNPIVKIRYDTNHFYLASFPLSIQDLGQQSRGKLQARHLIEEGVELKFQYCDPWNDMVEIQTDTDFATMKAQIKDRDMVLIEVSKVNKLKKSPLGYDLKGFVSFFKELSPKLTSEFKFIMEEGDQIPCEDCFGKGVRVKAGKKSTCANCSGCGARPITGFWELMLQLIDYRLNQRIFEQVGQYFEAWSESSNAKPAPYHSTLPPVGSAMSFNTELVVPKQAKSNQQILPDTSAKNFQTTFDKNLTLSLGHSKLRLSTGNKPDGFSDILPSSVENSDGEHSLIKQSPLTGKQPLMGAFQHSFTSSNNLSGPSGALNQMNSSSGLWPAAQTKITMTQSPKPTLNYPSEGRVRAITNKLQVFAEGDMSLSLGGRKMSDEEQQTTKKDVKFEWTGGSKEVLLNPQKPEIQLSIKNNNDFDWGPWMSFILKSPNLKKSVPLERIVSPGETLVVPITDLQGLGDETMVVQLRGLDEKTFTKYTSEKLELLVRVSK